MSDSDIEIVRNYRCTKNFAAFPKNHQMIEECARNVKNVKLTKVLGSGTFGTVYLAEAMIPNNRGYVPELVAVKRIDVKARNYRIFSELFDNVDGEVDYTYLMGEVGIGPKVYDAFYINLSTYHAIQYIFMDPGDGDMDYIISEET